MRRMDGGWMDGGKRGRGAAGVYQLDINGRVHPVVAARVPDKRGIWRSTRDKKQLRVCKLRGMRGCLGERGEPTLSPPRFLLHQCTWMKGNLATMNRLVRCSPNSPVKKKKKKNQNSGTKKKEKSRHTLLLTKEQHSLEEEEEEEERGKKSSAARVSLRAMRRIEK